MNGCYFKLEINNRLYLKERCFQIQILAKVLLQQFFRNDLFRIYAHKSLKELVGIYTKQGQKNLLMRPMNE